MSLLDQNKAARRSRILKAARRLMAREGYAGLTMRELAQSSRVSVPTVYNLIGGKDALLEALMEELYVSIAGRLSQSQATTGTFLDQAFAVCQAGHHELLENPRYARQLMSAFLQSPDTSPLRREIDLRFVEMMAGILAQGRAAGQLADWAEPVAVSRAMYGHYTICLIAWSQGDIDDDQLRDTTAYGHALQLLGVARGRAKRELERVVVDAQPRAWGSDELMREAAGRTRKEVGR